MDEGTSGKPVCCVRVYSCGIREFCSVRYCTGRGRMCACVMRHLGAIDEVWVEWSSGDNFAYFERVNEALRVSRGDARACSNEARTVLGAWTESPRADDVMWDLDAFFFSGDVTIGTPPLPSPLSGPTPLAPRGRRSAGLVGMCRSRGHNRDFLYNTRSDFVKGDYCNCSGLQFCGSLSPGMRDSLLCLPGDACSHVDLRRS